MKVSASAAIKTRLPIETDVELVMETYRQKGGINAEIFFHKTTDGDMRVVARYGAKKGGFTSREALEMSRDLMTYQQMLLERKVVMPAVERLIVEQDPITDASVIVKTSSWTGLDVQEHLRNAHPQRDRKKIAGWVEQMGNMLVPLCQERFAGWETMTGIDPRCSNFTVDARGKMWFVDVFPPRFRKHGQPLVEWPEPKHEQGRKLGFFKHFDVRGILLCATAQLSRARPELKSSFETWMLRGLRPAFQTGEYGVFEREFKESPWRRLRDLLSPPSARQDAAVEKIIRGSYAAEIFGYQYGVYALRELALELAAAGVWSHERMEKFFHDSHFEDELSPAVVNALEEELICAWRNRFKKKGEK